MTLVTLPRPMALQSHDFLAETSLSSFLLDASGEKWASVVDVQKTGNLRTIRFRLSTTTTGETLRAGIYTVDPATGFPTATAYGGMAVGTVAVANGDDNVEKIVTLATDAAATAGDQIAVVIEFDSAIGALNIAAMNGWNGLTYPYGVHAPGGTWAKQSTAMLLALGYDDGTYPPLPGCAPFTGGIATVSFNLNTAGADEYALKFTAPVAARLMGALVSLMTAAGSDFEFLCYDGTTALQTRTYDGDVTMVGLARIATLKFPTPVTLAAGDVRRIALRPTTTTGIALNRGTVGAAAVMEAAFGANFVHSARVNQGAWDDAATTILPFIVPLFDQLDDGAGGGGGLITHPGMAGGMHA